MGNRGWAVFKRDNRKYKLDISNLDYDTVIANLKKEYEISSDCCIVLEKKLKIEMFLFLLRIYGMSLKGLKGQKSMFSIKLNME